MPQATPTPTPLDTLPDEALVTQGQLKTLFGNVSDMTIWRWRQAGLIPEPTHIRGRNFWRAGVARATLARLTSTPAAA
ncbi:helix-turn-helix transcriptional regulator [Thiocystis violascens]|uniref:Uncharacterized protein n=1 Tax=Thiocystis violascens (strain ATCC 17096 / DSM 198 / 6111) TaxID=765911 RepID=I3Y9B0_THIV6|nr:hypothetical protein [Thiocystis violascens]AFL73578.1 hypothetical protein Thivi_1590 [Thiocystis violascens DSM 198]